MNKLDSYAELSRNDFARPVGFTKNNTGTKGLISLGAILFAITTIVGWYMITGPESLSLSYMMANLFLWGTSLVIILIGIKNRNI